MRPTYQCAECGATNDLPLTVRTITCQFCGDVCFVTDGKVSRMYPSLHMLPADTPRDPDYPLSKWMPTQTRPVLPGWYDCRFRTTGDCVLRLWWNGMWFAASGKRVVMDEFLTWRGVLA